MCEENTEKFDYTKKRKKKNKKEKPLESIPITILQIHLHYKTKLIRQGIVVVPILIVITVVIDVVIEHPYNIICIYMVPLNGTNESNDYIIYQGL